MEWHPVAESTEERQVQTSNIWFIVTSQYAIRLIIIQLYTWLHYTQLELCPITWTRKIPKCSQTLWETWKALPRSHLRKLQTNVLQWITSKAPHKTPARFKTWFIPSWYFYFSVMLNSFTHIFWVGYSVYAEGKVAHLVDLMFSSVLASAGHWSRSPIGCACSKSPTGEEWHCSDGDQSRGRDSVVGSSHTGRIHIWPWV